jgi:cellulose synthase operon protein C
LEGQALVFAGRVEEGLELMETVRRDFPSTRAAAESYLAEARYYASENLMVEAQRRLIELADNYSGSELAPVALYEAAFYTLSRGTDSTRLEANLILNRLADNYPEHPLVFYGRLNQGNLLRSFNDFGGAEVIFERLLLAFPNHKDRAIVEMALAECILAQTDTSISRLDQAIGKFERLAELPDLPIDLRVEASWKWAFSYKRRNNPERVNQIYWLAINQFLINEDKSEELGPTGRYWMSRIVISLGESLEELGDVESAKRVYSYIGQRGLPFNNLAEGKLSRLAQKKG